MGLKPPDFFRIRKSLKSFPCSSCSAGFINLHLEGKKNLVQKSRKTLSIPYYFSLCLESLGLTTILPQGNSRKKAEEASAWKKKKEIIHKCTKLKICRIYFQNLVQVHAYNADLSAVFNHSLPYSFIMITFRVLKTNSGFFLPLE